MVLGLLIGTIIGACLGVLMIGLLQCAKGEEDLKLEKQGDLEYKLWRDIASNKEIKLLNISDGVYKYYRNKVKGNKEETLLHMKRKINRNWMLGELVELNELQEVRRYGNLFMALNKRNSTIVWLENRKGDTGLTFNVDINKKTELEKKLGLI